MADPIVPDFNITREQIAAFVKDPRTVRDIEAFLRMVREQLPTVVNVKVDSTRQIIAGGGLTGTHDLTEDVTLAVGAGTGITVGDDAVNLADTAVTPGTYGDASNYVILTVDAQGRITDAQEVALPTGSGLLDTIGSTRGSILYRGASGWAALTPGTSGQFLKTLGAGADPAWGTVSGGSGGGYYTQRLWSALVTTTNPVNSTSFTNISSAFSLDIDFNTFAATQFRIVVRGNSTESGQTIKGQLQNATSGTPASSATEDITISNAAAVYDGGWITRTDGLTGLQPYIIRWKGSNATVDLSAFWVDVMWKV